MSISIFFCKNNKDFFLKFIDSFIWLTTNIILRMNNTPMNCYPPPNQRQSHDDSAITNRWIQKPTLVIRRYPFFFFSPSFLMTENVINKYKMLVYSLIHLHIKKRWVQHGREPMFQMLHMNQWEYQARTYAGSFCSKSTRSLEPSVTIISIFFCILVDKQQ